MWVRDKQWDYWNWSVRKVLWYTRVLEHSIHYTCICMHMLREFPKHSDSANFSQQFHALAYIRQHKQVWTKQLIQWELYVAPCEFIVGTIYVYISYGNQMCVASCTTRFIIALALIIYICMLLSKLQFMGIKTVCK